METGDAIDRIITDEMEGRTFPGIVILVRKEDQIIYSAVRGKRQLYPGSEPMTIDTLFDLASLTKPLATTVTALSVFEEEGISPQNELGKYLPELADETASVTLHQLLTHSSGLPPEPDIFRLFPGEDDIEIEEALNHLFSLKPTVKPGTRVIYSCTGYIFLARILKRITGKDLPELFKTRITEPGAVDGLMFNPSRGDDKIAATEYCPWRKRWIKGKVHDENSHCLGGAGGNAGLFGTASGVMELLCLFKDAGVLNGKRVLSRESVRLMTTNQTPGLSPKRAYGFLMQDDDTFAGPNFSNRAFGHTGFAGTSVWSDPDRGLDFVILTNRVHLGRDTNSDKIKSFRKMIHTALVRELF